jgi:hypothetical protein
MHQPLPKTWIHQEKSLDLRDKVWHPLSQSISGSGLQLVGIGHGKSSQVFCMAQLVQGLHEAIIMIFARIVI